MDESIISTSGLTKRYGNFVAVGELDLTIGKGEVYGLLGPNGAGKSTTILLLLGLAEASAGKAMICGFNPATHPIEVRRRVGYLPDDVGFYDSRSGLENLLFTARLNSIGKDDAFRRAWQILEQVGLASDAEKKAGTYSRGMRQRLGLADVLIKNPSVIILDEPTLGIDPQGVREFLDLIVRLSREQGLTVLLSSHHLHQVQQVCDRVGLFVGGKLIADGTIDALSTKLFASEPIIVEAGFAARNGIAHIQPGDLMPLTDTIRGIEGVGSVSFANGILRVGCVNDRSSLIARAVFEAGYDLTLLQKKRHGLDEIYHRYFQESEPYGKTA